VISRVLGGKGTGSVRKEAGGVEEVKEGRKDVLSGRPMAQVEEVSRCG